MTIYTYYISKNLCDLFKIPFQENPNLSDQTLNEPPEFIGDYRPYGGGGSGIKNGHYGCKHSLETRKILSEKAKGRVAPNKGIPNPKQKEKMTFNNPMKNPEVAAKVSLSKTGKPSPNKINKTFTWYCKWCNKEHTDRDIVKKRKAANFCNKSCAASFSNTNRYSSQPPAAEQANSCVPVVESIFS